MKLVEIKDVRPGQIWQSEDGDLWLQWEDKIMPPIRNTNYYAHTKEAFNYLIERKDRLIGFLGITHRIEGNRLVEIPRAEFEVDDVVQVKDGTQRQYVLQNPGRIINDILGNPKFGISKCYQCIHESYGDRSFWDFEFKKIGIFGVTHEFVNERLVK